MDEIYCIILLGFSEDNFEAPGRHNEHLMTGLDFCDGLEKSLKRKYFLISSKHLEVMVL